jgi:hypothetical protein
MRLSLWVAGLLSIVQNRNPDFISKSGEQRMVMQSSPLYAHSDMGIRGRL